MMNNKWVLKFRHLLHDLVEKFAPESVKNKIMGCEEITRIMASETNLPITKKFWFSIHNFICTCCSSYKAQFNLIKINSKKMLNTELTNEQKSRIESSKKDILNLIKKAE